VDNATIRSGSSLFHLSHALLVAAPRVLIMPLLMLAVLFPAAGRFDWTRGWLLGGLFLVLLFINLPLVAWKNPALVRERFKARQDTKPFDRVFARLYTLGLLVFLLVAGLDAGRFGWSSLPDWSVLPGAALLLLGDVPMVWALMTNPHLETTVRIQSDRGHRVITSGPYRYIRHPMYAGLMVAFAGMPLVLGSLWSYLPVAFICALLVWRTSREDRTLQRELDGYRSYAARTRYRLLPPVW
jgi:protein-S-isoprenylcysteine O-methyltransferase Ste14